VGGNLKEGKKEGENIENNHKLGNEPPSRQTKKFQRRGKESRQVRKQMHGRKHRKLSEKRREKFTTPAKEKGTKE